MRSDVLQDTHTFERLYTLKEVAIIWRIGPGLARKLFRGRTGVLNVASGAGRPAYRIPASVLLEAMQERGYTREQAENLLEEKKQYA